MAKNIEQETSELISKLRKACGSINLQEIIDGENPQLSAPELMARANDAEIFYTKYLDKVLRLMSYLQQQETIHKNIYMQFGRGTVNGIYLVQQWFVKQLSISRSRFQTDGKPTPGEITG